MEKNGKCSHAYILTFTKCTCEKHMSKKTKKRMKEKGAVNTVDVRHLWWEVGVH